MRDGALPAIALCLIFGMMLAYVAPRTALAASLLAAAVAVVESAIVIPVEWRSAIVIGCWSATMLFAISVYAARPLPAWAAGCSAVIAGLLVGLITDQIGRPGVLAIALPCLLIQFPARWLVSVRRAIFLKVLTSWIVAVALLSIGLTVSAGVNSGSDHLD